MEIRLTSASIVSKYSICFECGSGLDEHDYTETHRWNDEEGYFHGEFEEHFERYVEMVLRGIPDFDPKKEIQRQLGLLQEEVEPDKSSEEDSLEPEEDPPDNAA